MPQLSCACLAALFLTSIAPVAHAQGPEEARENPAQPPFPAGDTSNRTEAATAASPPAAPLFPAAAAVQTEPPLAGTPLALPPTTAATPAAPAADVPAPRRT